MLRLLLDGRRILALAAALFLLAIAAPAWALTTGTLRVTVVDDEELPVPGASLELSGETLIGGKQQKSTDADGNSVFNDLPPGQYRLVVVKAGFQGVTLEGIQIDVNRTYQQNVTMKPGNAPTEVTVVGKQAIDTSDTTTGVVMDKTFLSHIPAGRSYQEALSTVPGVSGGNGGNPNMAGSGYNENTYMLDGANITDPVTGTFSLNFNFDAIQQIEVLLGSFTPEYGTSTGGIVNIITDSGTNNLQFQSSVSYLNGNWGPKTDERLSADGVSIAPTAFDSQFETFEVSSLLSGPLVRDKAWFILSYSMQRSLIANSGIPQARDFDGHYLLTKLTMQPNPEHRIQLLFQTNPTTIDNTEQTNPFIKAEAQNRQAQGGAVGSGKWQWFLSPSMNLDTLFTAQSEYLEQGPVPCTHDRTTDRSPCKPTEAEGYVDWETPGRYGVNGAYDSVNSAYYDFDHRWNYSASTKLSVLAWKDPLGGTHDFKFGLEGKQTVWDRTVGYNGNILFVDINQVGYDPNTFESYYWGEITGPIKFRTTGASYDLFAQDSWKPRANLTINYGSRFDAFVNRNDLGEAVIQGALLGPRLFAAWDPNNDQKTKIMTGYGRFNDVGNLGVASFTSASSFGEKIYYGEYLNQFGIDGCNGFNNNQSCLLVNFPKDNVAITADRLRSPRVDEVTLLLQRELVKDLVLTTQIDGKFTRYIYTYDDRNLVWDSDGSALIGSRFADSSIYYARLRTPTLSKRDYVRWDARLEKIYSRRWYLFANYSYTSSVGSTETQLDSSFANGPQTQYNYGPLTNEYQNTLQVVSYWDLPTDPWTQRVGALLYATDGFPRSRQYISETNPSGFADYDIRIEPRGTYTRIPPYWYLNLSFEQDINVRKGQLALSAQVFNVFNNRAPISMNLAYLYSNDRLVAQYRQDPLQLQLGVSYKF
jgi:hypothetical protein